MAVSQPIHDGLNLSLAETEDQVLKALGSGSFLQTNQLGLAGLQLGVNDPFYHLCSQELGQEKLGQELDPYQAGVSDRFFHPLQKSHPPRWSEVIHLPGRVVLLRFYRHLHIALPFQFFECFVHLAQAQMPHLSQGRGGGEIAMEFVAMHRFLGQQAQQGPFGGQFFLHRQHLGLYEILTFAILTL